MEHANNISLLLGCNNQAFPFQPATGDFHCLWRAQSLVTKVLQSNSLIWRLKMSAACPDYLHLQNAIRLLLQLKRKTPSYMTLLAIIIIIIINNYCMMHLGLTKLSLVLHIKSDSCILFPVFCQCSSWHLGLQHRHDTNCSVCYKYIWLFS